MSLEGSSIKVLGVDLQRDESEAEDLALVARRCQEEIRRSFAKSLPGILKGYEDLALRAMSEEVRLKASNRILDTFSPIQNTQAVSGTTIQIVNSIPLPEMSAVGGKSSQTIEIAGATLALDPPRKLIQPADQPRRRAEFLGPTIPGSTNMGIPDRNSSSPAPVEKPTKLPPKP